MSQNNDDDDDEEEDDVILTINRIGKTYSGKIDLVCNEIKW